MTNKKEKRRNNTDINSSHIAFQRTNERDLPLDLHSTVSKSDKTVLGSEVAPNTATSMEVLEDLLKDINGYVHGCLRKRCYQTRPMLKKPKTIVGNNLVFRNATIADAAFIVALRTHVKKSKHISKIPNDIKQQEAWLEKYTNNSDQAYFIILNKESERVGTVRLYDIQNDSFCWGSWILKEGVPSSYAIESALLVYHFALSLGFCKAHFDVRKNNKSVWKFHERFGAHKIAENTEDFFYNISLEAIENSLRKFKKYLPNGLSVEY